MSVEPWQKAEIPGPLKAIPIRNVETLVSTLKKFKRPIIIVGHRLDKIAEGINTIDYIVEIAKTLDAPIVVTNTLVKKFYEKGYDKVYFMTALEIFERLRDPEWSGLDGKGPYDLAIFIGFQYYYEWLILSGLKHFAYKHLKTLTLDPQYQPHATWSLPTMPEPMWIKMITSVVESLKSSSTSK